jgi:mono/diheme cytochrome c family protein
VPTTAVGDVGAGAAIYAASCQRCHPNGQAGVAPAVVGAKLPGPLFVAAGPDGRHGVTGDAWAPLLAYLVTLGAIP